MLLLLSYSLLSFHCFNKLLNNSIYYLNTIQSALECKIV